jgi:hypothetical protein
MQLIPRTATFVMLLAALSWAGAANNFPLEVGNLWVYETGGTVCCRPVILEVVETAQFKDNTYFRVQGLPRGQGDYWIRMDDKGSLLAFDPEKNAEQMWYAFQAPEREPFETELPFSMGLAEIISRDLTYQSPIGQFDNAIQIAYPRVFQVGISSEIFVPEIGLVHRTENTGGASSGAYELVYARVGKVIYRPDNAGRR